MGKVPILDLRPAAKVELTQLEAKQLFTMLVDLAGYSNNVPQAKDKEKMIAFAKEKLKV